MSVKSPKLMGKGLLIIAIPAVFQLIFGIGLAVIAQRLNQLQATETHSIAVMLQLGKIETACFQITKKMLRLSLHKSVAIVRAVDAEVDVLTASNEELRQLVQHDPVQTVYASRLKKSSDDFIADVGSLQTALKQNDNDALTMAGMQMRNRALRFGGGGGDEILDAMRKVEQTRLDETPVDTEHARMLMTFLMVGLFVSTLVTIGTATYLLRDIILRLYAISKNAEAVSIGGEMQPAMQGKDEIAKLDRVLHRMAQNLKDAAHREAALVSNAADVIFCIDKSLMISSINKAGETQWRYKEEDLMRKRIMALIPEENHDEVLKFFQRARQSKVSETSDVQIVCRDHRVKTFSWNVLWSQQEDLLFCVAHDVSEARRVEQAKRDFVNMVSHDIRTPLSGMAIFLEMIPMGIYGEMNDPGKSRANALAGALNRIVSMVNDLLDIEKMQSGQFQIFKTEVDAASLVKSSIEMVQGFAEQQQITLRGESAIEGNVACDEARIIQVLQNLMSNAVKFSEPGKTVTLRAERHQNETRFEVIDQGKGIAKEYIPTLFDRFTQAKNDGSKRQAGFGLGLAICKDIIERHGGQIGVTSEVGKGSTFWLTIPNEDAKTETPVQASAATPSSK